MAYYDFKDSNTVHIKYKDPIAAFYCQQFLDEEYIASLKAHLIVKWIDYQPEGLKRGQKLIRKTEEAKEEESIESEIKSFQIQKNFLENTHTEINQNSISGNFDLENSQALIEVAESSRKEISESTKAHLAENESQQFDLASESKVELSSKWIDIETPHHTMFYKEAIHDLSLATDESIVGMNSKIDQFNPIANGSEIGYMKQPYLSTPPSGNLLNNN